MKQPAVYLMASKRNGTLYVGVTSNLIQRAWQHRNHVADGFTDKYDVNLLVWFEQHEIMESAIAREKAIKKWNRAWKLKLIEERNPGWADLWPVITGEEADCRLDGNLLPRHSRAGGNPEKAVESAPISTNTNEKLDSRLRGNDDAEATT